MYMVGLFYYLLGSDKLKGYYAVVDTGVMIGHEDFKTNGVQRAIWGHTSPRNEAAEDGNGHGTHVASTIVGTDRGVAKSAKVFAVKVLRSSGYGSNADVIDVTHFQLLFLVLNADT